MEALQNLKRTNALCYNLCIICQENKPQRLQASTEQGIARISEATELRKKLRDMKFIETIDRLTTVLQNSTDTTIVWHNACYATYTTSREKIERLRKNENEEPAIYQQPGKDLRSSSAPINWNLCLFCQENKWKKKLNIVSSPDTSKKMLESARLHPVMGVRLACISDLEATKSKYHISCYTKFFRETLHNKDTVKDPDTTMALLCKELENSASHGDVLELNEVWDRYCAISKENNVEIPHSFVSRMSTFKEKLVPLIRKFYEIIVLIDRPANGRRTVFVPIEFSRKQWSNRKNEDDDTVLCTIPEFRPQDEDF